MQLQSSQQRLLRGQRQRSPAFCRARSLPIRAASDICISPLVNTCEPNTVSKDNKHLSEPVLRARIKAHSASLTAALVIVDEPGLKEIATASLDKTLATWRIEPDLDTPAIAAQRNEVPGAPVFALVLSEGGSASGSGSRSGSPSGGGSDSAAGGGGGAPVWCGLATKDIASWQPGSSGLSEKVRMNGHTGWVRSLATSGRYLFSCGCNHLRQWDTTFTVPREVASQSLFTGDILAIAATDTRVFTAGADGSVRAWVIGRQKDGGKEGELRELASREKAHDGRVTALAVAGSLVFSVSYDGRIKGWDVDSLNLVVKRSAAHDGARIQCAAVGADGLLYTGG